MDNEDFSHLWRQLQGKSEDKQQTPCLIAAAFLKKMEAVVLQPLATSATRQSVAQAKYLLQDEYHAWRKALPATHPKPDRHQCLGEVYESLYDKLYLLELTLRPPAQFIIDQEPPPPPPPAPPQIAGIFFGELEAE